MAGALNAHQSISPNRDQVLTTDIRAILEGLYAESSGIDGQELSFTSQEIQDALGWGKNKCQRVIEMAQAIGVCRPTKKIRMCNDGVPRRVAAYVFDVT